MNTLLVWCVISMTGLTAVEDSIERRVLLIEPQSGLSKLYACGLLNDGPWCIFRFDDVDDPRDNPKMYSQSAPVMSSLK